MKIYYNLAPTEHAIVDVNITDGNFSASASIYANFRNVSSGQCLEELAAVDPVLVAMWREWHLNDMQAGTPAQMELLKDFKGDYTAQCEFLGGLLIDNGYKYGSARLKKELPQSVYDWFNGLKSEPFTDWPVVTSVHAQAKKCDFADYHQHHVVTVKHNGQKIKFNFWASESEPANLDGAIECFLSDADSAYMTAEDISSEFGVSIKEAKRLYKGFQKAKAKAEKLGIL